MRSSQRTRSINKLKEGLRRIRRRVITLEIGEIILFILLAIVAGFLVWQIWMAFDTKGDLNDTNDLVKEIAATYLQNISSVGPGESLVYDGDAGQVKSLCAGEGIALVDNDTCVVIVDIEANMTVINNITSVGDGESVVYDGYLRELKSLYPGDNIFIFDNGTELIISAATGGNQR